MSLHAIADHRLHPSATDGRSDIDLLLGVASTPLEVELIDLVRDLADRPGFWRHLVRVDPSRRTWARLEEVDSADAWVLTWAGLQATDLHDHGSASAAFVVVSGSLLETRVVGGGVLTRRLDPGAVATVAPGVVHDVLGGVGSPAVSIHVYAPRLESMTYYAWRDGVLAPVRTVTSDEPEGEW